MRVIYISHGDVPSRWAHALQAVKMAEALARRVHWLELLTRGALLPGPARHVDPRAWYGLRTPLRIRRLPVQWRQREPLFTSVRHPRFDAAAAWYARLRSPDLVYARSGGAAWRAVRLGLDTILEVHGNPEASPTQARRFARILEIARSPRLRGLVTVTEFLAERYVAAGFPESKLFVWPDAVDPDAYGALPERAAARRALGIPEAGPLAVYAGHLYDHKGIPCLVDAAHQLPELRFCLVGGWPADIERVRRRAAGLSNLRLEGFVPSPRVPLYLAAADVLVLPHSARSIHAFATSPLKLFEYMAAGRPLVATAIPAFEGLLRHGENAYLAPPDAPEALACALKDVLADAALAGRLAAGARRDVEPFTWERRADAILARFATEPRR